ncbi:MAG: ArnT family glycosyltransferase [Aggregatilineales bacterium]
MRKELAIWLLLCLTVGAMVIIYLSLTPGFGDQAPLMPLDDAYIHFQYARQMAEGHPFTYNTVDGPTSGATSLIYVPLLAVGYKIGFTGLALAYWAMGIGVGSFLLSAWLIYRLIREAGGSRLISSLLMFTFVFNGAFVWHALSGMETTLFVFSVLWCLYTYQTGKWRAAVWAGVLVALVRPEGAFVAVTLAAALAWWSWRVYRKLSLWNAFPVFASGLQPVLNLILTGSFAATGTQAKSQFYDVTSTLWEQLSRVGDALLRMWSEFIQGYAVYGDPYIPGLIILLAIAMIVIGIKQSQKKHTVSPALLAGVWMALISISVATLETAFWHYKRYQMPILALSVPLAGWLLILLTRYRRGRWLSLALAGAALLLSIYTNQTFVALYGDNVLVTTNLQFAMAKWIDANLPAEARVGVFDVGIVRYVSKRYTYDVVGLTTPQVAGAMRQGPGAVYDTMAGFPQQPDYFALYPTPRHPSTIYLMRTRAWGEQLANFETPDVPNTTSAGNSQIVARADWADLESGARVHQSTTLDYLQGFRQVGMLNVGDLTSERAYSYTWQNHADIPGFLTSLDQLPYYACGEAPCTVTDGTRGINGEEKFALPAISPDESYRVVLRVNAAQAAQLEYGCGKTLGTRVVPEIPGNWVELVFPLPGISESFCIRVKGTYYPARYWIYAGHVDPPVSNTISVAAWDKLSLLDYTIQQSTDTLTLDTTWLAKDGLQGDGKLFVHLYTDPYKAPISQWDGYLGKTLPLADLLPGVFHDQVQLSLKGIPPGKYILGLGFYDRSSGQRYAVQSKNTDTQGQRVFLDTITIR